MSRARHPFKRITARTVTQICKLSETLTPRQREMVADNALSIAQAHFSEGAWMRAISAGPTPVGFLLLHSGSDYEDGIDCPGVFLWRMMIAKPYQGRSYGRLALERLCAQGEDSPGGFYRGFGFTPTGSYMGMKSSWSFR